MLMNKFDRTMRWKRRMRGDDGVASVIGTIFAILVLLTLLSLLITTYIPAWEKQNEQEFMNETLSRFSTVKSVNGLMETDDQQFVSIPLAPSKVPLFGKTVLGKLDFTPSKVSDTSISVDFAGLSEPIKSTGSLEYLVYQNSKLEQRISYEMGAVVVFQPDGGLVKVAPQIAASPSSGGGYDLRLTMYELVGDDSERIGDGASGVRLDVNDIQHYELAPGDDTVTMVIDSAYAAAWEDWLNERFMPEVADSVSRDGGEVTVIFNDLNEIEITKVWTEVVLE